MHELIFKFRKMPAVVTCCCSNSCVRNVMKENTNYLTSEIYFPALRLVLTFRY